MPRARLRREHKLRRIVGNETYMHPSALPNGIYCYEEVFAMSGLRGDRARGKPRRVNRDGHTYPIEIHRYGDESYVVGWVSEADKQAMHGSTSARITLWMRRQGRRVASSLVEVPVACLDSDGESRGDGCKGNDFRLLLDL